MTTDKRIMLPVKKWHTNFVLKGWPKSKGREMVFDLHCTKTESTIISIWKLSSILERIKFLFHGEITFESVGNTHPPISILISDAVMELKI